MKLITILSLFAFITFTSIAQVVLPYYTGFDNDIEKAGWTEYKKAATTYSNWGYGGTANSFSGPSSIAHDYSPSTNITLTDNWYVSPAFLIPDGGKLDSVRFRFSGFSVPGMEDTVAIYLLNGSQDPDLASSKTLLVDFRDADYIADMVYRVKTDIDLTASNDSSYIAIRYRNSDCSSLWLTVQFDNIAISANDAVAIDDDFNIINNLKVYPNPNNGIFKIESEARINEMKIYSISGVIVYSNNNLAPNQEINITELEKGIYFIETQIGTKSYQQKIVLK